MAQEKVKSITQTSKNWESGFAVVPQRYADGVDSVNDFKAKALAGQETYVQQMTNTEVLARREAALSAMPDNKWKDNAKEKGSKNIVSGMRQAKGDYEKQMQKVLAVEAGVDYPARGIGIEVNNARSLAVGKALEDAKKAGRFR